MARGRRKGVTSMTAEDVKQFQAEQTDSNYPTDELTVKSTPDFLTFKDETGRAYSVDLVKIPIFNLPELVKYKDKKSLNDRRQQIELILEPLHGLFVGYNNRVGEETLIVTEQNVEEVQRILGLNQKINSGEANG